MEESNSKSPKILKLDGNLASAHPVKPYQIDETIVTVNVAELNDLSDEIILLILKYLNAVDLCAVGDASQRLRAIAKDATLWRNVVINFSRKSLGSDRGQSTIRKIIDDYLSWETSSLEIRPVGNLGNFATLEGERNLRVRKDTSCIHMIVEKEPPISFDFAMLVNIGRKCPSLESLMLVDCRLVKFCGQESLRRRAYLTSLKNLVFQWCAAGDGRPRGGRCRKTLQFEWAWELWIGRLAILAPALRTLCFLDCFDSSLGKV